jgi:hypothetical protein
MNFDLLLKRETLGSATFAAAVVFLTVALTKVYRIAANTKANKPRTQALA